MGTSENFNNTKYLQQFKLKFVSINLSSFHHRAILNHHKIVTRTQYNHRHLKTYSHQNTFVEIVRVRESNKNIESRATFDRMGELLRTLLLLFLLIGDSADCRRTRRIKHDGQKACNTVRRCHNLQCCISTVHGGVLEIGSLMFITESAGYRNRSLMITKKCLPELSFDDLKNFQEKFLQKIRPSGNKAEKEKYRCWLSSATRCPKIVEKALKQTTKQISYDIDKEICQTNKTSNFSTFIYERSTRSRPCSNGQECCCRDLNSL